MKKIAVITGASSGMGRRFAETVDRYGRFDEVWVIARHQAQLEALKATVPFPIRVLALDLTDRTSFGTYAAALAEEPVQVGLLMNCSGYGKFSAVLDTPLAVNLNMTDLNCQAVVAMCQLTAPYMPLRQPDHQHRIGGGVPAYPLYRHLRRHKSLCPQLQPRPEPGAAQPRHRRDGGVPLLDKDRLLRPRYPGGRTAHREKVRGHV